jgi:hypothetical protein
MLIKQAKDKGLNLGAAIDAVKKFQEQNAAARAAEPAVEPAADLVPAPAPAPA